MEDFLEAGRHSPEELEQELFSRNSEIEIALQYGNWEVAEEFARDLIAHSHPAEFRLDGFYVLGRLAAEDGSVDDALDYLEQARRLAVDTESYRRAAEIQRAVGLIYQEKTDDRRKAEEAFALRRYYTEAAEKFPPRRFIRLAVHDDHED